MNCAVCNNLTFTGCDICSVALHFPNRRSETSDGNCVTYYHDHLYFGLAAYDYKLRGLPKKDWVEPAPAIFNANVVLIKEYDAGVVSSVSSSTL